MCIIKLATIYLIYVFLFFSRNILDDMSKSAITK